MDLAEAITTAIEYESRVGDVYAQAADRVRDTRAKRVLEVLADEEAYHLDYLKRRQEEWLSEHRISREELRTAIPSPDKIEAAVARLKDRATTQPHPHPSVEELEVLKKCVEIEEETTNFYKRLVEGMNEEYRPLFARFQEIEAGHLALVMAELDTAQGLGFWFDIQEFDLEAG